MKTPYLAPLDPTRGHHHEAFRAALSLARQGIPPGEAQFLLPEWWRASGERPPRPGEIEDQVSNAYRLAKVSRPLAQGRRQRPLRPRWIKPAEIPDLRQRVLSEHGETLCLWGEALEHRGNALALKLLSFLFKEEDLVCMGDERHTVQTLPWAYWRPQLEEGKLPQYLVPNPMTGAQGPTKAGKLSPRALTNSTPPEARKVSVIEFDRGTLEEQGRLLHALELLFPLLAVVFSGGKSLHGWFTHHPGDPPPEALWSAALALGADPSLLLTNQMCRFPGGTREGGRIQSLLWVHARVFLGKQGRGGQA